MAIPTLEWVVELEKNMKTMSKEGDLLDAIVCAVGMITERCKKLKFTKQIIVISDASRPIGGKDQLDQIADGMISNDISLHVYGVDFDKKGVKMEEGTANEKEENVAFLTKISEMTHGSVISIQQAMDLHSTQRKKLVSMTTAYRGPFQIGEASFNVFCYAKSKDVSLPTLSKESTVNLCGVKMSRSYFRASEKDSVSAPVEIDSASRIAAHAYGKEKIAVSKIDADHLKYKVDKCLVALGFLDLDAIPRHFFMGCVDVIVSEPGDERAGIALTAFVRACIDTKKGIVVRFVKRNNSPPKLGLLIPFVDGAVSAFYHSILPFSEDIRDFTFGTFEQDPTLKLSSQQRIAARELVACMSLDEKTFNPDKTYNPTLQRFFTTVETRAADPDVEIAPLSEALKKYVVPNESFLEFVAEPQKKFAEIFPLIKTEVKVLKKRRWRDVINANQEAANAIQEDGKDADLFASDERAEFVSPANPIESFTSMMTGSSELFEKACVEMWVIVRDNIFKAMGNLGYSRAIMYLETIRSACINKLRPELFNSALISLKKDCDNTAPEFNAFMETKQTFPISNAECVLSTFSQADVSSFFRADHCMQPSQVLVQVVANDDFDELA